MQREKIVFELVKPSIAGFSVEPMEIDAAEDEQSSIKRKADESTITASSDEPMAESVPSKTTGKKNKKSKKIK